MKLGVNMKSKMVLNNSLKSSIFILEEDCSILKVLIQSLNEDFCISYTDDAKCALNIINEKKLLPDVVIIGNECEDINLIIQALHENEILPQTLLFILLTIPNKTSKLLYYNAGAIDCIDYPFSSSEFIAKIESCICRKNALINFVRRKYEQSINNYFSRKLVKTNYPHKNSLKRNEPELTAREQVVFQMLSKGLLYKEIADQLSISVNTVKGYIKNIYKKTGVHRKMDLFSIKGSM